MLKVKNKNKYEGLTLFLTEQYNLSEIFPVKEVTRHE